MTISENPKWYSMTVKNTTRNHKEYITSGIFLFFRQLHDQSFAETFEKLVKS
jgi:hypothetical protein